MEFGFVSLGDNLPAPAAALAISDAEKHLRLLDQAVAAEAAGFSIFQVGEHHFNYYTFSSPAVVLSAVAQVTRQIRLGSAVTLLPTLDPVVVAEDFSTLDVLSGGRAEIAVGRGVFGAIFRVMNRSAAEATELLGDGMELLHRLLAEEDVSWSGQCRPPLDRITIRPRPIQRPIPLWCGSTSMLETCARLGIPCMWVSVLQPYQQLAEVAAEYRAAWSAAGRPEDDRQLGIAVHYHVAATSQQARRRFAPHYWHYHECSDSLEKSALRRRVRPQRRSADMLDHVAVVGSPAEVTERIAEARALLGLTRISLVIDMGGLPRETVLEVIDITGSEVIPALR
jgi:alkanesulfonate monooxygenase SsuD/methylene tetrahydromethanopterin reductase-like flavin-dependent oxidoreductase (luciferase family)